MAGALFAQTNGFADVTSGIGTIVIGLAAVIVGETVVRSRVIVWMLVGCVVGSILYRIAIQVALNADFIGLRASDLNLVTALLVAGALILPRVRNPLKARSERGGRVPMITAKNLHVTFGRGTPLEKHALRGVDLAIPSGQFVTVIGSNGAGKSTVLGALAGDVIPERGTVAIDDTDVTRWNTPRRAGLVARVFQDPMAGTCATLSIEENMALAAARGRRRGLGLRSEPVSAPVSPSGSRNWDSGWKTG